MIVRCIYGSAVQAAAEKAGLRDWCDQHCDKIGISRGYVCYDKLTEEGINPNGEHKKLRQ
ncbi:hypothetical protein SAMN02745687_00939 [Lachnospiraceae bacterium NK3A20]|nr:hypothetical protein SAMN02745687_00939 [Lachnospiraceae bacterium NK3A20]